MTRSGLRLNVDSRSTDESVSLFKISVTVNARVIRIYLLPIFLLVKGSSSPRLNFISARCTGKFQFLRDYRWKETYKCV
jgi:hypothetical protein